MPDMQQPLQNDADFKVWDIGYRQGVRDGRLEMRNKSVTFLQDRYTDIDKGPERGSNEAKFMLDLMRELMQNLNIDTPVVTPIAKGE